MKPLHRGVRQSPIPQTTNIPQKHLLYFVEIFQWPKGIDDGYRLLSYSVTLWRNTIHLEYTFRIVLISTVISRMIVFCSRKERVVT